MSAKDVGELINQHEVPEEYHELIWRIYKLGAEDFAAIQMERWVALETTPKPIKEPNLKDKEVK